MAGLPLISIVTPSYQQGRFLEWTIRSVLLQRYPNLEYVVMDGGSTDQTQGILERYKPYFAHVESQPDRGHADAVARGFTHTHGEIMAFLNSDDLLAPGALEFAARAFTADPAIDAIYSHRVFIDENNTVGSYWILPPHNNWLMKRWDYIPQETCFWRRRIYEAIGGIDPSYKFGLDYDFFIRFMNRGRMRRVNRFLGAFRLHPPSPVGYVSRQREMTAGLREGQVHPEVERARKQNGVWFPPKQWVAELALHRWVERQSRRFVANREVLPGALPGVGYNYDQVWDGQLNETPLADARGSVSESEPRPPSG
ncbi:MAG: glycosyltransferase family 2 protein [Bryobacteraceae bacterium]